MVILKDKRLKIKAASNSQRLYHLKTQLTVTNHIPVKAFFAPVEDPAGITFSTLNLTVFEIGLKISSK